MGLVILVSLAVALSGLVVYRLSMAFSIQEPNYTEVLVMATDKFKIYARKSNQDWQQLSNHIKENLCYSDKPSVPFMSLVTDCHSINMTLEVNGVRKFGWSENIKLTQDFSIAIKSHLDSKWDQILNKRSIKKLLG